MQLTKHIHQLLFTHKCVIVPEFGAFLINEKAVELNKLAKYANPNRSVVSFNRQITSNDGLLANHLCTVLNISYSEANNRITSYVADINTVLKERRNVEIKGIGTFYLTPEEKLVFIPYHSVNFNTSSYGLPKIRLTEKQFEETTTTSIQEQPQVQTTIPAKRVKPVAQTHSRSKEHVEAQRREKRQERQVKKQAKQKTSKPVRKRIYVSPLNMVATLFLAVMAGFVVYFEQTSDFSYGEGISYANLVDTQGFNQEEIPAAIKEIAPPRKIEKRHIKRYTITTESLPIEEAEALHALLLPKYTAATVDYVDNSLATVSIIAFSNKTLAHEYLSLMQNNVDQNLVIIHK